jgi:hypothetical protein
MNSRSIRLFACVAFLVAVVATAKPVAAQACGKSVPCNQDPNGGGQPGGGSCVSNCTACDFSCNTSGWCYPICPYTYGSGGCGCDYVDYGATCVNHGSCTYE